MLYIFHQQKLQSNSRPKSFGSTTHHIRTTVVPSLNWDNQQTTSEIRRKTAMKIVSFVLSEESCDAMVIIGYFQQVQQPSRGDLFGLIVVQLYDCYKNLCYYVTQNTACSKMTHLQKASSPTHCKKGDLYLPLPIVTAIWVKSSDVGLMIPRVAATPDETPIIPRALPAMERKLIKHASHYGFE